MDTKTILAAPDSVVSDAAQVKASAFRKLVRTSRIRRAIETPVRHRTAEQAALIAIGRLIESGWCK